MLSVFSKLKVKYMYQTHNKFERKLEKSDEVLNKDVAKVLGCSILELTGSTLYYYTFNKS